MKTEYASQAARNNVAHQTGASPWNQHQPGTNPLMVQVCKLAALFPPSRYLVLGLALMLVGCDAPSGTVSYRGNHFHAAYTTSTRDAASASALDDAPANVPNTAHVETAEEKQNRLALQLGLALAAKLGTRPDADDDLGSILVKAVVSRGADAVIESTVDEAFSDQGSVVRRQISIVLEAIFEGDLTLSTVGERNQKAELLDWLKERSPDAAQNAQIIDFLYEVYQRGHTR